MRWNKESKKSIKTPADKEKLIKILPLFIHICSRNRKNTHLNINTFTNWLLNYVKKERTDDSINSIESYLSLSKYNRRLPVACLSLNVIPWRYEGSHLHTCKKKWQIWLPLWPKLAILAKVIWVWGFEEQISTLIRVTIKKLTRFIRRNLISHREGNQKWKGITNLVICSFNFFV